MGCPLICPVVSLRCPPSGALEEPPPPRRSGRQREFRQPLVQDSKLNFLPSGQMGRKSSLLLLNEGLSELTLPPRTSQGAEAPQGPRKEDASGERPGRMKGHPMTSTFLDRLRRLPSPGLPEARLGRTARPDLAPVAAAGGPGRSGGQGEPQGQEHHHGLARGRAGHHRHVGPQAEAPEGIRGDFKPIDTKAAGVQISEHLPKMAQVMDNVTIVRSLCHNIGAHGRARCT